MIYLFNGNDAIVVRAKWHRFLGSLQKKRPDASLFVLSPENWSEAKFEEFIRGQGLFVNKFIVACDDILADKKIFPFVTERIDEVKRSDNLFVFFDTLADEEDLKVVARKAEQVVTADKREEKKNTFNLFSISDAFGRRDRKTLWVQFAKGLRLGVPAEEMYWKLSWIVKSMLSVKKAKDPAELGLKGFTLQNCKRFAGNYTDEELASFSERLLDIYGKCRGGAEFEIETEKLIFEI